MKIVYFHGFASSGASGTATTLRHILYERGWEVCAPDIPVQPAEALTFLTDYVAHERPDLIVATSMGCLYAEQMRGTRRILVNPSFHMARLLTFRGLGRREFRNKRQDGARDFKVDRPMIEAFKAVEAQTFKGITPADRALVYGLFGTKDRLVNCQKDYLKAYGRDHFATFEGEHFLNDKVLSRVVMPLIEEILINEK